jgi:hypothetical protein
MRSIGDLPSARRHEAVIIARRYRRRFGTITSGRTSCDLAGVQSLWGRRMRRPNDRYRRCCPSDAAHGCQGSRIGRPVVGCLLAGAEAPCGETSLLRARRCSAELTGSLVRAQGDLLAVLTNIAGGVASVSGSPQPSAGTAFPALTLGRRVRDLNGHRANDRVRSRIHASSYGSARSVRSESVCV